MNSKTSHPEPLILDQLRAGLLDDQTQLKVELEKHLQHCEQCRRTADWQHIADLATIPAMPDGRLESIRNIVMNTSTHRTPRFLPIAAAASVILLAAASILFSTADLTTDTATVQARAEPVDIYEDLDFYLWMADHTSENGQPAQTNDQQG